LIAACGELAESDPDEITDDPRDNCAMAYLVAAPIEDNLHHCDAQHREGYLWALTTCWSAKRMAARPMSTSGRRSMAPRGRSDRLGAPGWRAHCSQGLARRARALCGPTEAFAEASISAIGDALGTAPSSSPRRWRTVRASGQAAG
jgi:hypothetical protein